MSDRNRVGSVMVTLTLIAREPSGAPSTGRNRPRSGNCAPRRAPAAGLTTNEPEEYAADSSTVVAPARAASCASATAFSSAVELGAAVDDDPGQRGERHEQDHEHQRQAAALRLTALTYGAWLSPQTAACHAAGVTSR